MRVDGGEGLTAFGQERSITIALSEVYGVRAIWATFTADLLP